MNREQMIAKLAEAGTDKDALAKLSDCQLKALLGATEGTQNAAEPQGDGWDMYREERRKREELERRTANAVQTEENERTRLLGDILYAQHREFTDDEVKAMDIVMLRKVHKTMFPRRADYSARGGPATQGASFDFVQPIMSGPAGSSVLDRKEAN